MSCLSPNEPPKAYNFIKEISFSPATQWQHACITELKKCILDRGLGRPEKKVGIVS